MLLPQRRRLCFGRGYLFAGYLKKVTDWISMKLSGQFGRNPKENLLNCGIWHLHETRFSAIFFDRPDGGALTVTLFGKGTLVDNLSITLEQSMLESNTCWFVSGASG